MGKFLVGFLLSMVILAVVCMFINMNLTIVVTMHPFWRASMVGLSAMVGLINYKI